MLPYPTKMSVVMEAEDVLELVMNLEDAMEAVVLPETECEVVIANEAEDTEQAVADSDVVDPVEAAEAVHQGARVPQRL